MIKSIQIFYKTHKKYKQLYIPELPEEENDGGVGGYSKRKLQQEIELIKIGSILF